MKPNKLKTIFRQELDSFSCSDFVPEGLDETAKTASQDLLKKLLVLPVGGKVPLKQYTIEQGILLYRFDYVGLIAVKDILIIVYPKYMQLGSAELDTIPNAMTKIFEVLLNYSKKKLNSAAFSHSETLQTESFLALYKRIVDDYMENGIYRVDEEIVKFDGEGEIDWDKTIDEVQPVLKNRKPFYLNFFSREQKLDEKNICERIHRCILTFISRELAKYGLFDLLNVTETGELSQEDLEYLGSEEFLLHCIDKELNSQFITHKRMQLEAMKDFIKSNAINSEDKILHLGTCSFNMIWEEVCQKVFKNQWETIGKEDLIKKPQWNYRVFFGKDDKETPHESVDDGQIETAEGITKEAQGTLKPDIVTVYKDKLIILDAKYYFPEYTEAKISGQPGISDVTKQYLYQVALQKYADDYKPKSLKNRYNAFLMPIDEQPEDGFIRRRGKVSMKMMKNLHHSKSQDQDSLSPIYIFEINAEKAYDIYLNKSKISPDVVLDELNKLFDEADKIEQKTKESP